MFRSTFGSLFGISYFDECPSKSAFIVLTNLPAFLYSSEILYYRHTNHILIYIDPTVFAAEVSAVFELIKDFILHFSACLIGISFSSVHFC